jgi:hypothetical protein
VNTLPREAREGLMRAWLELLRERHPGVTWVAATAAVSTSDKAQREEVSV